MLRMRKKGRAGAVLFAVLAAARSAWPAGGPDASLPDAAPLDAAFDATAVDSALDAAGGSVAAGTLDAACEWAPCPVAEPAAGDPCDPKSLSLCEYGDDRRYECNRLYGCTGGHVQVVSFSFGSPWGWPEAGGCPTTLSARCPPSRASLTEGAACTPDLRCQYVEGECACVQSGVPGEEAKWECQPFNHLGDSDAACPVDRPHLGAPCLQPSGYCSYDFDCTIELCSCGKWALGNLECPPLPPAAPVDGGAEGGDAAADGSIGRGDSGTGTGTGAGAMGSGGGCGCRVADRRPSGESEAGGMLGIALLMWRRRSRRGPTTDIQSCARRP
jgi:hypothetical protein